MKKLIRILTALFLASFFAGCSEQWLEEKQDIKLIVPKTLYDYELLLNANLFEYDGRGAVETSCDDYEFTEAQLNQIPFGFDRDLIIWKKNVDMENLSTVQLNEWRCAYSQIQVCNVVLNGLLKIEKNSSNEADYNRIYGTALYHRSKQFLNMVMTFSKYYVKSSASTDLGIPLKLDDDINEPIKRSTLEETYNQIVNDLRTASNILPATQIDFTKVSKSGAFALLARTLLYMDNYSEAKTASDSSFKYNSFIEDFNKITNISSNAPLNIRSKEIHVRASMVKNTTTPTIGRISNSLYSQYIDSDLRKGLFFKTESDNKVTFKGSYMNSHFTGTTTGEILLILAETKARLGDLPGALNALNLLSINRYKNTEFVPFAASNSTEALEIILKERRKELVTRGLRWQDLKRFNLDTKYAKTLTRTVGDNQYFLPPNDLRYVLPIPQFVLEFNHIEQNQY